MHTILDSKATDLQCCRVHKPRNVPEHSPLEKRAQTGDVQTLDSHSPRAAVEFNR
jgi:hypothetical protein